MVWSKWKAAALLAGLICASTTCCGWVHSQQGASQPMPAGVNPSEVVVVNEPGKPPQHCVLQKTVRMPNGQTAVEVRNLASGEVTTLIMMDNVPTTSSYVDPKAKPAAGAWAPTKPAVQPISLVENPSSPGNDPAKFQPMPVGTPVKPAQAQIPAQTPAPVPAPTAQFRTVDEPGKPPTKCRLMAEWTTPEGHKAAQLQAVEGGEIMTMVEIAPVAGAPGSAKVTASLYHWGKSTTAPAGVPAPPLGAMTKTVVSQPGQTFSPSDNVVYMPSGSNGAVNAGQKPSLGDYVKNAFGGLFGGRIAAPTTTTMPTTYKTSPVITSDMPRTNDAAKPVNVVKGSEKPKAVETANPYKEPKASDSANVANNPPPADAPKLFDAPKFMDTPMPVDPPKTIETPKLVDAPKLNDTPKSIEAPKPLDLSKPVSGPKMSDALKLPEAPKRQDAPKPVEVPKVPAAPVIPDLPKPVASTPALPSVPAAVPSQPDYKSQWAPVDPKAPGFGKPASDTTLPLDVKPSLPALPSTTPAVPTPLPTTPVAPAKPSTPVAPPLPSTSAAPSSVPAAPSALALPPTPTPVAPSTPAPVLAPTPTPPVPPSVPAPAALLPVSTNTQPALPSASAPLPTLGASKRIDPLDSPEVFLAKKAEEKMFVAPAAGSAQATDSPRLPGAGSVAAASAADPRYLPMTAPQSNLALPNAELPTKLPETFDAASFSNAFTPPMPPDAQRQEQQMPSNNMMPQGNPAMMPQGYGPMVYNGPMPPNPMMAPQGYGMPMMPAGYAMPMMPYANPAMDRPGMPVSGNMSAQNCVSVLQSSIYPSQREAAIFQLSNCDWRSNPHIVQLLLTSAKNDPAPMVRAAAVGSLARMGVATDAAQVAYNQLKTDADPRVRQEAEHALAHCGTGSGMQAAGGR